MPRGGRGVCAETSAKLFYGPGRRKRLFALEFDRQIRAL